MTGDVSDKTALEHFVAVIQRHVGMNLGDSMFTNSFLSTRNNEYEVLKIWEKMMSRNSSRFRLIVMILSAVSPSWRGRTLETDSSVNVSDPSLVEYNSAYIILWQSIFIHSKIFMFSVATNNICMPVLNTDLMNGSL